MTDFAGETYEIFHAAFGFDGVEELTNAELPGGVTVSIWNRDYSTELITEAPMAWTPGAATLDDGREVTGLWIYRWDTDFHNPGTFKAKCTAHGSAGTVAYEYLTIRLRKRLEG